MPHPECRADRVHNHSISSGRDCKKIEMAYGQTNTDSSGTDYAAARGVGGGTPKDNDMMHLLVCVPLSERNAVLYSAQYYCTQGA